MEWKKEATVPKGKAFVNDDGSLESCGRVFTAAPNGQLNIRINKHEATQKGVATHIWQSADGTEIRIKIMEVKE